MKRAIAVLGTASDVGKSVVATALCRILSDRGESVAPFKAQNMSNNAGVTAEGLEMGRAQIVQALAARQVPHVDMNPVLIKPGAVPHVVLLGQHTTEPSGMSQVAKEALHRLQARHERLVIEGAGSCAEVNLRSRDFVNFETAHRADADCVIVADIDKGGVFAQVIGTLRCIEERDRARVRGFIVNRFRGRGFQDGVDWIERETGLPVFGVLPWLPGLDIDPEDGLPPGVPVDPPSLPRERVRVGVLAAPSIANHDELGALARRSEVALCFLRKPRPLDDIDLLVLPGSKHTRGDLEWMDFVGWRGPMVNFRGSIVGICGGYQMLGRSVADPRGVEGEPGVTAGLGLLDVETEMTATKQVSQTSAVLFGEVPVEGYEIHCGMTAAGVRPSGRLIRRGTVPVDLADGAVSGDGRVWGTYLHGIFDSPEILYRALSQARPDLDLAAVREAPTGAMVREAAIARLAEHVRGHVDVGRVLA